LRKGAKEHLDEIICLGSVEECRSIFSLHAGFTGVQGSAWTRHGAAGIALPGLMEGKVEQSSLKLKRFCGRMAYLLGHVLVDRMLSGTTRSNQGIPSDDRLGMTLKFREWLQTKQTMRLRSVEAITMSLSSTGASPHYDSQNDSRRQFDHICFLVNYHHDLHKVLSPTSCSTMLSHGINPQEKVAFTFIAYTRGVIGSQTDLVSSVSLVQCPLFRCFTSELNDESFERHDVGNLEDMGRRSDFYNELESLRGCDVGLDYKSSFAIRDETLSRDILLGSMLHLWFLFVHAYAGLVKYWHCVQFVVFIGRETNGPMLIYQVITELIAHRNQMLGTETRRALADKEHPSAFFIFISKRYLGKRPEGCKYPSVSHHRWQPGNGIVYLKEGDECKVAFLLRFLEDIFCAVLDAAKPEDANQQLLFLVCRKAREQFGYNAEQRSILEYGPIRGTYTIQLAARFGVIPTQWESFAQIEKGKSGFYRCVNSHLEATYGHPLSTSQAQGEVKELLARLKQHRHPVDMAVLDQVGCRWHRVSSSNLKKDVYFWDLHNGDLMNFYRRKLTKNGHKIQLFWKESWRNLDDYNPPFYSYKGLSYDSPYLVPGRRHNTHSPKWVKNLPSGSLHPDLMN
jgi:hypothetical protein